jgi:hypothetical protein
MYRKVNMRDVYPEGGTSKEIMTMKKSHVIPEIDMQVSSWNVCVRILN